MDFWIMPAYTQHDDFITVPDARMLAFEEAQQLLTRQNLRVKKLEARYQPEIPRDAVIAQDPAPNSQVKPGRHIYLKVNSGELEKISVPDLHDLSRRQAINLIAANRLKLGGVLRDTMPSPYKNIVTVQSPKPGMLVIPGAPVTIWISDGLGTKHVKVPDVTGMDINAAELTLLNEKLRMIILPDSVTEREPVVDMLDTIQRQSPPSGTDVPEGSEIRTFVHPSSELLNLSVDSLDVDTVQ
jgi:beta-lactam-binding protein with PASTA domain